MVPINLDKKNVLKSISLLNIDNFYNDKNVIFFLSKTECKTFTLQKKYTAITCKTMKLMISFIYYLFTKPTIGFIFLTFLIHNSFNSILVNALEWRKSANVQST